jgi:hypothetical protein
MQKYKQAAISIAFLTVIFSSGLYTGYFDKGAKIQNKKNFSMQETILETFENHDYKTWQKLVADRGEIGNVVKEADFNKFISARSAARNGDYDQAISIAKELENTLKNKLGIKLLA